MKKIMHFLFLSCLKATELMEKKLHIKLNFKNKIQLKIHKSMCKACQLYDRQNKFIDKSIKNNPTKGLNINIQEFKIEIKNKINKK